MRGTNDASGRRKPKIEPYYKPNQLATNDSLDLLTEIYCKNDVEE